MLIIICFDGMAPEYVEQADTPVFDWLARHGRGVTGTCQMPSVTNVNNVSILTGEPPVRHGINANFALGRDGQPVYMESPDDVHTPLILERAAHVGQRVAAISSKQKLAAIIGRDAHVTFSAEQPLDRYIDVLGAPPPIYSYEVNHWLLRAGLVVLEREQPDLLYITTTDYLGHMTPPESDDARANFAEADRLVGELIEGVPDLSIAITADHGMNAKTLCISPEAVLAAEGIDALSISTLQDRYVKHHGNMSGSAYIHFTSAANRDRAAGVLAARPGVERVLSREEAAAEFHLDPERIGDLVLLGDRETAFGAGEQPEQEIEIRSHGSLHEQPVPIITWGPVFEGFQGMENRSIGEWIQRRYDTLQTSDRVAPGRRNP